MNKKYSVTISFHGTDISDEITLPDSLSDKDIFDWIISDIEVDWQELIEFDWDEEDD